MKLVNSCKQLGDLLKEQHLLLLKILLRLEYGRKTNDNNAILLASENGHLDIVKLLLNNGCDPTIFDNYAIMWASHNGHLDVVKLLFKWYLIHRIELPNIKPLNKIKQEIIHETFLIYELALPDELCDLIQKFT
jgi:hypothetical protein